MLFRPLHTCRRDSSLSCPSTNATIVIGRAAAEIANLTWTGPRNSNGESLWPSVDYQARLTGSGAASGTTSDLGYASTLCSTNGTCFGLPTGLGEAWLGLFVKKDPSWDYSKISSVEAYAKLFHVGVQEYDSIVGSADPDLSAFRDAGGKILTYHGLVSTLFARESERSCCWHYQADGLIPTKGIEDYYNRVNITTPRIDDFFRYFEVPGLAHCSGGIGGQPKSTFMLWWIGWNVVLRQRHCRSNSMMRTASSTSAYCARTQRRRN